MNFKKMNSPQVQTPQRSEKKPASLVNLTLSRLALITVKAKILVGRDFFCEGVAS